MFRHLVQAAYMGSPIDFIMHIFMLRTGAHAFTWAELNTKMNLLKGVVP